MDGVELGYIVTLVLAICLGLVALLWARERIKGKRG